MKDGFASRPQILVWRALRVCRGRQASLPPRQQTRMRLMINYRPCGHLVCLIRVMHRWVRRITRQGPVEAARSSLCPASRPPPPQSVTKLPVNRVCIAIKSLFFTVPGPIWCRTTVMRMVHVLGGWRRLLTVADDDVDVGHSSCRLYIRGFMAASG